MEKLSVKGLSKPPKAAQLADMPTQRGWSPAPPSTTRQSLLETLLRVSEYCNRERRSSLLGTRSWQGSFLGTSTQRETNNNRGCEIERTSLLTWACKWWSRPRYSCELVTGTRTCFTSSGLLGLDSRASLASQEAGQQWVFSKLMAHTWDGIGLWLFLAETLSSLHAGRLLLDLGQTTYPD